MTAALGMWEPGIEAREPLTDWGSWAPEARVSEG